MDYKKYNPFLEGKNIYFCPLEETASDDYSRWINDREVITHLEVGIFPRSQRELSDFVKKVNDSNNDVFFAVIEKETKQHIGNIKLGPINWVNRTAVYGRLIGEKSCWGKGYGKEIARLILHYAFTILNLNKVTAGAIADNIGSIKSNEKVGLLKEGILKQQVFSEGKYKDIVLMGITRDRYLKLIEEEQLSSQIDKR